MPTARTVAARISRGAGWQGAVVEPEAAGGGTDSP
jgi:hypothetical protein